MKSDNSYFCRKCSHNITLTIALLRVQFSSYSKAYVSAGIKYNFSETIGISAMYNYNFSSSFYGDTEMVDDGMRILLDRINYFGKKSTISVGLTFNVD